MKPTPNIALKVALIHAGLNGVRAAKRSRIHPSRFSAIQNGRIVPNEDEQRRIARAVGLAVYQLWPEVVAS